MRAVCKDNTGETTSIFEVTCESMTQAQARKAMLRFVRDSLAESNNITATIEITK